LPEGFELGLKHLIYQLVQSWGQHYLLSLSFLAERQEALEDEQARASLSASG
jgi:hypothetical protein